MKNKYGNKKNFILKKHIYMWAIILVEEISLFNNPRTALTKCAKFIQVNTKLFSFASANKQIPINSPCKINCFYYPSSDVHAACISHVIEALS